MPSNNHIAGWQDDVQFGKEGTYGTLATTLNVWGVIGEPDVDPGPEFLDSGEGGSGTSERQIGEFAVGKKQATIGWNSRASDSRVWHLVRSLSQLEPVKTGAGPYAFKWNATGANKFPWIIQPAVNIGYSIVDSQLDLATGASPQFLGAICEMFSIESEEGGFAKLAVKFRGTTATLATSAAATTLLAGNLWSHYHLQLKAATVPVTPSKFKAEFTNNLIPFYGTSQTPTDLVMGQLGIKGSFSLPFKGQGLIEYGKFIAKTNTILEFDYATGALLAAGNFHGKFDVTYSNAKLVNTNGLKMIDFEFTQANAGTPTVLDVYTSADLSL